MKKGVFLHPTIRAQIILGFIIVITMTIVIGYMGYDSLRSIGEESGVVKIKSELPFLLSIEAMIIQIEFTEKALSERSDEYEYEYEYDINMINKSLKMFLAYLNEAELFIDKLKNKKESKEDIDDSRDDQDDKNDQEEHYRKKTVAVHSISEQYNLINDNIMEFTQAKKDDPSSNIQILGMISDLKDYLNDIKTDVDKEIIASKQSITEVISTATIRILIVTAAAAFIGLTFGIIQAFIIYNSIAKVRNAAEEIAAGNLGKKIEYKSKDEIGKLAVAFNIMTEKLKSSYEGLEDKIREKTKDLERSNKDLEQFAYVASHDLQEPLRMVTSYMQLLEKRYKDKLDENAREFIDFAVDGATRMRELIQALLAYSRVTKKDDDFEEVDMNKVVDEALMNLEVAINESKAEIKTVPLPRINGSYIQLVQLFQNIIGNAIKYRGDNDPKINIAFEDNNGNYLFTVKDNGIGFQSDMAEKIFIIFQRLHKKGEYKGTGIGLAMCKKIVENHFGNITAESEIGTGSVFKISIPKTLRSSKDAA